MKTKILVIVVATGIGALGTYMAIEKLTQSRVLEVQAKNVSIRDELFGYTKYTDYIAAGKQVLTEQAKFFAVKGGTRV